MVLWTDFVHTPELLHSFGVDPSFSRLPEGKPKHIKTCRLWFQCLTRTKRDRSSLTLQFPRFWGGFPHQACWFPHIGVCTFHLWAPKERGGLGSRWLVPLAPLATCAEAFSEWYTEARSDRAPFPFPRVPRTWASRWETCFPIFAYGGLVVEIHLSAEIRSFLLPKPNVNQEGDQGRARATKTAKGYAGLSAKGHVGSHQGLYQSKVRTRNERELGLA